jgi:cytochrome c553
MALSRFAARRTEKSASFWRCFLTMTSLFALLASMQTSKADSLEPDKQRIGIGNPIAGKQKSDVGRCQECHGADGLSSDPKIPNHAGQYAGYLIKQLNNFQAGERRHQVMDIMAEDLTATDINDIAAYFASQKVMQGDGDGDNSVGNNLFINGDKARDIPACASCHGEKGKGRVADNVTYPVIGGQRRIYLRTQLVNWKLGERTNSPNGVMNKIAKSLTDNEIDALVNYVSGL